MAHQSVIVEDEVLQHASLYRHHHDAMRRGDRRNHTLLSRLQAETAGRAGAHAHAAAEADIFIHLGFAALRLVRIVGRDERHRFDRASVHALDAAVAFVLVNLRHEMGRVNRIEQTEAALGDERFTTTAATIANKVDAPLAPTGYTN